MSLNIIEHFDKNNLHHAYLIEGMHTEVVPEILKFLEILDIDIVGNPDFYHLSIDSFKIEDARNLKSLSSEKGFSSKKKIFLISANNFLLEAQNTLLKIFEEPIENTHFFIITPDINTLQKTLISRFYLIRTKMKLENELIEANKFITMPLKNRIDFIKELIVDSSDQIDNNIEVVALSSTRSKSLKFLNALESTLQQKLISNPNINIDFFDQLFKVRKFLNQPGSSIKTLMESVALVVPNF